MTCAQPVSRRLTLVLPATAQFFARRSWHQLLAYLLFWLRKRPDVRGEGRDRTRSRPLHTGVRTHPLTRCGGIIRWPHRSSRSRRGIRSRRSSHAGRREFAPRMAKLAQGVKRHPELPPLRHEELPPPWVHDLGCCWPPVTGRREAEPTGGPSPAGGLIRPLLRLARSR